MIATPQEIAQYIGRLKRGANNGEIFSVTFVKRTDGTLREMVCRLGVRKHLKGSAGKGRTYDPAEHKLLTVFDMQAREYRNISLDSIVSARVGGIEYQVARPVIILYGR